MNTKDDRAVVGIESLADETLNAVAGGAHVEVPAPAFKKIAKMVESGKNHGLTSVSLRR